jgi:serine/threonine protein phosphatase PrpC
LVEGLRDHRLAEFMRPPAPGGAEPSAARRLVEASLAHGARDNVTALVIEVI